MSLNLCQIFSSDGNLLTGKIVISKRRVEHFSNVLNKESNVDESLINKLPRKPILEGVSAASSIAEIKRAIIQLTNGMSSGNDGKPAEKYKCGRYLLVRMLCERFSLIWDSKSGHQVFKDTSFAHLC